MALAPSRNRPRSEWEEVRVHAPMDGVSDDIVAEVQRRLDAVQREEDVVVLLAVESGSRAWGFPSADSDFDVRFVYVRRLERYLSVDLEEQRDVIERPITDDIDLSGWDVRKAMRLYRKSNPPLLEWLQCSLVYRERTSWADRVRAHLPVVHSARASSYHYLHMAEGNHREYLHGDVVRIKKYFYVLRPLLAMLWIEQGRGPVPIEFSRLVEATITEPGVREAIDELTRAKRAGAELDRGARIPAIADFIERELPRLAGGAGALAGSMPEVEPLNDIFRATLEEAWFGSGASPSSSRHPA